MSGLTENQDKRENEPSLEWFDAIEVDNMPKVKRSSQLLSQQTVPNTCDTWKGSPVVNYKTFRKCVTIDANVSAHCSPPIAGTAHVKIVTLKPYRNPLNVQSEDSSQTRDTSKRMSDQTETNSQIDSHYNSPPQTKRKRNK